MKTLSENQEKKDAIKRAKREAAEKLRQAIMDEGSSDELELWESSPVRLNNDPGKDAVLLLRHFYQPDEILFLGDKYGKAALTVKRWIELIERNAAMKMPFIIPNPLTGREHETYTGKMSKRCDAAVESFRFAVAEFDDMTRADQLRFWSGVIRQGLLNVACLIDSGGKSIHAWIRVDVPDREAWDQEVKFQLFDEQLVPLGLDSTTKNPSRLSRLPGQRREKTARWQRLLWLGS